MGFTVGITGHTKGFGKHISAKCKEAGYTVEGRQQAESPEWIPAGSICSINPPITTFLLTSHKASTSTSIG